MSIRFSWFSSSLITAKRGGRFSIYRASICVRSQRKQPRDGAVWFRFHGHITCGFSFCSVLPAGFSVPSYLRDFFLFRRQVPLWPIRASKCPRDSGDHALRKARELDAACVPTPPL